jgi:hypothetical protein
VSGEDNVRHFDVSVLRQTVANLLMEANYQIPRYILGGQRETARRDQYTLPMRTTW